MRLMMKSLLALCLLGGTAAYAIHPSSVKTTSMNKEVIAKLAPARAARRFMTGYRKEFGSKGFVTLFSWSRPSDDRTLSTTLQLHLSAAAAQACWQEFQAAGFVNASLVSVDASGRYRDRAALFSDEELGEFYARGGRTGAKQAGERTVVFGAHGVTNGVLARVIFPGDYTDMYLAFLKDPASLPEYAQVQYCPSIPAQARERLLKSLAEEDLPYVSLQ